MKYIKTYATQAECDADENKLYPHVSYILATSGVTYEATEPAPPSHDYSQDYLTFVALEDGTFSFMYNESFDPENEGSNETPLLSYSLDSGTTWVELENFEETPTVSSGDTIMWKGELATFPEQVMGCGQFSSSGQYNVEGNAMSILYGDNFSGQTSLSGKEWCLSIIFYESQIVSAENLSLPATTLAGGCYNGMFYGCTSLTAAPQLPATTLVDECYRFMFDGCTSLTTAPQLPATTLADLCYGSMFNGCTSLTTAPQLPATTLVDECYQYMFQSCTSLSSITCLATNISASDCIEIWVQNVAANGTFTKDASMTSWPSGDSGIPNGWTVEDYVEE